jgi:undecaprenyl-diphosphatase
MDPIQSLVLGVVQGLTEFIPVSSSGHLQLVPQMIGWQVPSTVFILFTNLGTLLALIVYFRKEILNFIKAVWLWMQNKFKPVNASNAEELSLLGKILVATIPAGLIGLIVNKFVDKFYTSQTDNSPGLITAGAMILVGMAFILSEYFFAYAKVNLKNVTVGQAIAIGFSQALAFIRGVSRSGITILTAGLLGMDKVSAAKFSFLMSIPISTATSLLAVKDLLDLTGEQFKSELVSSLIGLVAAFVFGYVAIRFLLQFLQKRGLAVFGWYRIIFGIVAILVIVK